MSLRIVHTNDFHGRLTPAIASALRELRDGGLFFDTGDCIRTGNLGIPLGEEPAWALLREAGCDASTLGNRETHVLEPAFRRKLAGAAHPILCANLFTQRGRPWGEGSLVLERGGLRVGVLGVMVPMVTRRMASRAASAFLWEPPIQTASEVAARLRPDVDLLVALTHIGHRQDCALAASCPAIDIVLGGHSHTVLQRPERVGSTWVCQGGSHGRFAGVYDWDAASRTLAGGLAALTP